MMLLYSANDGPRVLFLSDHYAQPHGADGATAYFRIVLPELRREAELTVCFLGRRNPGVDRLEREGVWPLFLGRAYWDPRALADLVRIIRARDIEVVHAAGILGVLLGRLAAAATGARCIVHLHEARPLTDPMRIAQRVAPAPAAALATSHAIADWAARELVIPHDDIHVLRNPLPFRTCGRTDRAARRRVRGELGIRQDAKVIGVFGRLSREKGQLGLVRAMPRVRAQSPKAVLLVVGDGPNRAAGGRRECERLAAELGLDVGRQVVFAGHRDDVPDILASVDIVAVPSVTAGPGDAALHAMAAGRPVVASAVAGLTEVIRDGENGLLAPPGDAAALAAAILRPLQDRDLAKRLVAAGRVRVRDFALDEHVARLAELYDRLAALRRPAELTAVAPQRSVWG